MKKRILAIALVIGVLSACGWHTGVVSAAEITETPEEKTIEKIEVVDTESKIPYKSQFTKENIVLQITYSDATTAIVRPDKEIELDTAKLGKQTFSVEYQGKKIDYTVEVVPRQVQGVKVTHTDKTSATVGWDALPEAEQYEIYISSKENGTYTLLKSVKETKYRFSDLVRGKITYVKIRAAAAEAAGEYSALIRVAPKPDSVKKITSNQNVKTKITVAWERAEGATGYLVYYRPSADKDYILAGNTTELSFQVTGLKAGSDYYFQIYAYAGETDNVSGASPAVLFGTAPSIPTITKVKGGDRRVKVYWKKSTGADSYKIYFSTKEASGFQLGATASADESTIRGVDGLKKKKKYYVKVEAVRLVSGMTLQSETAVKSAKTASAKAKATSTKAKLYSTLKKFKKSKAYKTYKAFKKKVIYRLSVIIPGLKTTNVAGFNATRMVPQSVTFAGDYMLMSAYDYSKKQESVIYIVNKKTGKYITTMVLPHSGHVGGITFDGVNVWMTYGKNLQSFKFTEIQAAVASGKPYYELYRISSVCPMPETVSYVAFYKNKIWAGAYSETSKKYMYGYDIQNKWAAPSLVKTNRILMPNRTQGVAFTSSGKMLLSRSCQTKKGRRGFMSRLDTYRPTWNLNSYSIKKNKKKRTVKMPPMNEGIAISGAYTYIIYESPAFAECKAPLDRVTAFKTKNIS